MKMQAAYSATDNPTLAGGNCSRPGRAGRRSIVGLSLLICLALSCFTSLTAGQVSGLDTGLVHSVLKAPITPDGDVAGAVTDFVINLSGSMNPAVAGRALMAGDTIRITLPEGFTDTGSLPPIGDPGCTPPGDVCNVAVMLQGWPQHPIRPPALKYRLSMEGTHTIVYTALQDLIPDAPLEPGIKQLHLILRSWVNPGPGTYRIFVEAQTGPDGEVESGFGRLEIRSRIAPSIQVTSAFNEGTPNTIYQEANPGAHAPLPLDLLLWNSAGDPMEGVEIVPLTRGLDYFGTRLFFEARRSSVALLVQGTVPVGHVHIGMPEGAKGESAGSQDPSVVINSPVSGIATGHLQAWLRTGSEPGLYTYTFSLNGGNSLQAFVTVP